MNNDLTAYYAQRAAEYEAIYAKPERQSDLKAAGQILQDLFKDKSVLEIACGTGYWTQQIAQTAASVWATDINESVLEIARSKAYPGNHVTFETADLYQIHPVQTVDALFGGFIWSHIPLQEMEQFLTQVNRLAGRRNLVVLMDNRYVEGSSSPITNRDDVGNTYQTRRLRSGEVFDVLKNFPEPSDFERLLEDKATDLHITWLPYFWICTYHTR